MFYNALPQLTLKHNTVYGMVPFILNHTPMHLCSAPNALGWLRWFTSWCCGALYIKKNTVGLLKPVLCSVSSPFKMNRLSYCDTKILHVTLHVIIQWSMNSSKGAQCSHSTVKLYLPQSSSHEPEIFPVLKCYTWVGS